MQIALSTGQPVRTHHILNLVALILEARSCLRPARPLRGRIMVTLVRGAGLDSKR